LGEFNSQLPDSSFDLVFSISVLEHVSKEFRSDVYRDMFRILRPGGVIVILLIFQARKRAGRSLSTSPALGSSFQTDRTLGSAYAAVKERRLSSDLWISSF
jgi:ubiquinone/menaquinone biosynthesis C-methylase UbiE